MSQKQRTKLAELGNEQRFTFNGRFKKYGFKYKDYRKNHAVPTLLLTNIELLTDNKKLNVADHLWFNLTKGFKSLGILKIGDVVQFNGRIASYTKGYQGFRPDINKSITLDYGITRPIKVSLLIPDKHIPWTGENWEICNQIYDMYLSDYNARNIGKPYLDLY
ncbi:hypothetical protein FHL06_02810 [Lactobacillus halodurans]|uniref:Uncharacterized protein n=1 Tax=Companilactobacillus halodurans TaxID=2584183 RepID=A0A5P0ZM54_9LACO|nr:hypothetical protein [Companilactobacillus halodurans]MQS75325.1 hypothetical protein [Companilactobacillus halodurans]